MSVLPFFSLFASLALVCQLTRMRTLFAGLTLRYSWWWSLAATACLTMSVALNGHFFETPPALSSLLHLVSMVLLLTPAISALGARKPGVATWQVFVVVPLIVVLLWPGLSDLISSRGREPLHLGIPAFSGVCLVVLMTMSTCLGTSMTLAALFYFFAIMGGLLPAIGWIELSSSMVSAIPLLLFVGLSIARKIIQQDLEKIQSAQTRSELVEASWIHFQNLYGLVWAKRIQDRVNQFANREQWTVVLTQDGFRDKDGKSPSDHELEKPRDALRWVLTRFADETWICEKLFRLD